MVAVEFVLNSIYLFWEIVGCCFFINFVAAVLLLLVLCFSFLLLLFVFQSLAPTCTPIHFFGLLNSWCALICTLWTIGFSLFKTISIDALQLKSSRDITIDCVIVSNEQCRMSISNEFSLMFLWLYHEHSFLRSSIFFFDRAFCVCIHKCLWVQSLIHMSKPF